MICILVEILEYLLYSNESLPADPVFCTRLQLFCTEMQTEYA